MDTKRIRTRLERIEKRTVACEECRVLPPILRKSVAGETVPNVIDRPLKEWEIYKRSMAQQTGGRLGPIIHDDPFEEYRLRTGRDEAPPEDRVPVEAFWKWRQQG